ncbi:hypothetical protein [Planctomyces sp. SH-PL14]|uniref:hypothetical protein n=1 Tax=Planctomyces sp. SH-PL14 TaxID=1632864 RepID=UPI00078B6464|nr:hypothetical protein [Planctomyces sp. SH-PL14]AMV17591.1 hypothetical protein VT03_06840 [Planctomyces sp. SH-PL14]
MSLANAHRLEIPHSLSEKLLAFRKRVWTIKLIEAVAGALIGFFVAFLVTYTLDRFIDTPKGVRIGLFVGTILAAALVPMALERWVWRNRRLDQVARLLSRKHPSVGDQLLGIIELAESESEQARSMTLVRAAITQVAEVAEKRDFTDAVPTPRHKSKAIVASVVAAIAIALLVLTPIAARNSFARLLAPWKPIPRYTFAALAPLPERLVVAHGETFPLRLKLADSTEWKPESGEVAFAGNAPVQTKIQGNEYLFELPPQIEPADLAIRIGDYQGTLRIEPMLRPELSGLSAKATLPGYLERTAPVEREVRGGSMTLVKGSEATITATATRDLASAQVNAQPRQPDGKTFASGTVPVTEAKELEMQWQDQHGLSGKEPFKLTVTAADDEAPSVVCENLPRQKVVLDSEVLTFEVRARDDFGVKRVGIEWEGLDPTVAKPAKGERIIGAGGPEAEALDLASTFSGTSFGIDPQPIKVRVFVEDFLPGRPRSYSPAAILDVLNAEQHAVWVTAQLSRWQRMSLEVRDREMQLHETNKALRELAEEDLDQPDTRKRIEGQAAAERANGRRLNALVGSGEDLLKQAMRNPEIGVGHLEKWAEMLQVMKDISGNRMPSVADLLKQAAEAPQLAQNAPSNKSRMAGQNRANAGGPGDPKKPADPPKDPSKIPTITDVESTMNSPKPKEPGEPQESKPKPPRLTLPNTMLSGNGSAKKKPTPAGEKVEEAVVKQQDLLAEFDKLADELNKVLANLEGTTLVKRLKASSRHQHKVATRLGTLVTGNFGLDERQKEQQSTTFTELAEAETTGSHDVSNIMDDMHAYFERSKFMRFKTVLDDMRKQDVTAALRQLGDDVRKENGLSISQAEYWSETLDRWAEDLVEVTKCGACPGCKAKGSLPPSIVLEVLKILEGEVNLREETRVAEQARKAISSEEHLKRGQQLSDGQGELKTRIYKVVDRIKELPDAEADFGKELALLGQVAQVMNEAYLILRTPNTGEQAIAAETEAIELLLQSKRFNPNGGGGGGANPGGGGSGKTSDSALALVGTGTNDKEIRQDTGVQQATGTAGPGLPEEFRAGLDEYFNRLENRSGKE